ncbi:MAG: DUF86 domain-containing protein [Candidatus Aenigmarchaeota archaeon]|nr:DUF86 domain-containing protein [Candidatus Aenigmarchaeota archaeon]
MYDKERIGKIFSDIERYFSDLENMKIKTMKDLDDKKNFYSASMIMFSIINRTIDLGEEVIAMNKLGTPSTYKDIFFLLLKGKVINNQMKDRLSDLISYRNIFSHEYYRLMQEDVFNALERIAVVRGFVRQIKQKLNNSGRKP